MENIEIFRSLVMTGVGFPGNYTTISVEKLYQAFKKRLKDELPQINETEEGL